MHRRRSPCGDDRGLKVWRRPANRAGGAHALDGDFVKVAPPAELESRGEAGGTRGRRPEDTPRHRRLLLLVCEEAISLCDERLHEGARRTHLQHVEPPAEDRAVVAVVGAMRGDGEHEERASRQKGLLRRRMVLNVSSGKKG